MKKIADTIKDKSRDEKSKEKSRVLAESAAQQIQWKDYRVEIDYVREVGNNLHVMFRAYANNNLLPLSMPYIFVNPPILVPDGTKKKVKDSFGRDDEVDNFIEDHTKAFENIIRAEVELQRKIWQA